MMSKVEAINNSSRARSARQFFGLAARTAQKASCQTERERAFVRREGEKLRNLLVDVFPNKMKNSLLLKVPGAR